MKYSKGDKVRIRNIDWYEQMLSIPSKLVWQNKLTKDFVGIWCGSHVFKKEMQEFCGRVMTIQFVGIDFYLMEEDGLGYEFTDEMIAGEDVSWMYDGKLVAERFSDVGFIEGNISLCEAKHNKLCINGEMCADRVELEVSPEFEIKEEDGKWFAVKKRRYPQSYEECRDLIEGDHDELFCGDLVATGYMSKLMERFARLIMCRNAYWLTAGREMELGDMWEPDWSNDCRKFSIVVEGNEILADVCLRRNRILVFPTEEMRDEFLKVFRNDIEECKEFL